MVVGQRCVVRFFYVVVECGWLWWSVEGCGAVWRVVGKCGVVSSFRVWRGVRGRFIQGGEKGVVGFFSLP